jgi:hypothetical protein
VKRSRPDFIFVFALLVAIAAVLFYRSRLKQPATPASTVITHRTGASSLYPPPQTPGAIDPNVTQDNIDSTICRPGYTRTVRPPESYTHAIKRDRMQQYALPGMLSDYELDHMVPLELGGCPDCEANLWMEPWPDAHEKDRVENYLHREVCERRIPLRDAQRMIMSDWYALLAQAEAQGR